MREWTCRWCITWRAEKGKRRHSRSGSLQARLGMGLCMGAGKVQIFGQTYTIRGELDERYVQQLAGYVDERMSAIADATSTVDTQKAAGRAALALAGELHSLRRERGEQ